MSKANGKREHGTPAQSMIEFALVLFLLVLILMGVLDLGYAVYAYNTVSLSSREGARSGIICTRDDSAIRTQVKRTAVTLNLPDSAIAVTTTPTGSRTPCDGGFRYHGDLLTVRASYTYRPLSLFLVEVLGVHSVTLTAQSSMVVE